MAGNTMARRIQFLMEMLNSLFLSLKKLGVSGTVKLLAEKRDKKARLKKLLLGVQHDAALILSLNEAKSIEINPNEIEAILEKADAMLLDKNFFFTFQYATKGIDDPWNYDPLEKKYWQKRQYEETRVHGIDTPRDVKIVWEINRFKDLPTLAQAAYLTKEKKYADEVERRILSWIECNPFAASVNWSSPLELAIRAISWTASLRILALAGFTVHANEKIKRSLWQHAAYINAELSIDKIVRSNHLIGELCGLYALSSLYDFPEAAVIRKRSKELFIESVIAQTYPDGASRESSGWYHAFVTDFTDIFIRIAGQTDDVLPKEFTQRYEQMVIYRNSIMTTDASIVKFGDFDNGKALELASHWRDVVLGAEPIHPEQTKQIFGETKHITARLGNQYLFVRCGEFGWGGDGFSSHAHDDILSPVFNFDKKNFLIDPGTYVYNGDSNIRDIYRIASAHNGVIIGHKQPVTKKSFGWLTTRSYAPIELFTANEEYVEARCSYGEWKGHHHRLFRMTSDMLAIEDVLTLQHEQPVEWNFHFHPRWRITLVTPQKAILRDFRNFHFMVELSLGLAEFEVVGYEYSPSYMVRSAGQKIRIRKTINTELQHFRFEITRASE